VGVFSEHSVTATVAHLKLLLSHSQPFVDAITNSAV